jgi:hypothetical protein
MNISRIIAASTLSLIAVGTLSAGQVSYLGGTSGLVTAFSTSGPDTAYFVNATTTSCVGGSGCLTTNDQGVTNNTTTSNWTVKAFSNSLFGGATGLGTPIPGAGLLSPSTGPGFYLSSVGQVSDFGLQGGAATAGLYSLTIPVGLSNVSDVYTMLQDYWATSSATGGSTPTSVAFEFSSSSDGLSGTTFYDTVSLTNGQQIRSGIDCTTGSFTSGITNPTGGTANSTAGTCASPGATAPATTLASGAQSLTGKISSTLGGSTTSTNSVSVTASNVYSSSYSGGGNGQYNGGWGSAASPTTGNLFLDEQRFNFGNQFANYYLVAIILQNQMTPGASKVMLSAVDVVQAAPEPGTTFLFLGGLGTLGLGWARRKFKK